MGRSRGSERNIPVAPVPQRPQNTWRDRPRGACNPAESAPQHATTFPLRVVRTPGNQATMLAASRHAEPVARSQKCRKKNADLRLAGQPDLCPQSGRQISPAIWGGTLWGTTRFTLDAEIASMRFSGDHLKNSGQLDRALPSGGFSLARAPRGAGLRATPNSLFSNSPVTLCLEMALRQRRGPLSRALSFGRSLCRPCSAAPADPPRPSAAAPSGSADPASTPPAAPLARSTGRCPVGRHCSRLAACELRLAVKCPSIHFVFEGSGGSSSFAWRKTCPTSNAGRSRSEGR